MTPDPQPTDAHKGHHALRRMGFALAGLRWAWAHEASLRTEAWCLLAATALLAWLGIAPAWWALWALAALLLLAAELGNSAVERLADHLHPARHPAIGEAKDVAAAFVFLTGVGTAAVFALAVASALGATG